MSWIQTRRRAQEAPAGRPMEDTLRRQMAWAAGTEQFQHRDPLYPVSYTHLTLPTIYSV